MPESWLCCPRWNKVLHHISLDKFEFWNTPGSAYHLGKSNRVVLLESNMYSVAMRYMSGNSLDSLGGRSHSYNFL